MISPLGDDNITVFLHRSQIPKSETMGLLHVLQVATVVDTARPNRGGGVLRLNRGASCTEGEYTEDEYTEDEGHGNSGEDCGPYCLTISSIVSLENCASC